MGVSFWLFLVYYRFYNGANSIQIKKFIFPTLNFIWYWKWTNCRLFGALILSLGEIKAKNQQTNKKYSEKVGRDKVLGLLIEIFHKSNKKSDSNWVLQLNKKINWVFCLNAVRTIIEPVIFLTPWKKIQVDLCGAACKSWCPFSMRWKVQ